MIVLIRPLGKFLTRSIHKKIKNNQNWKKVFAFGFENEISKIASLIELKTSKVHLI